MAKRFDAESYVEGWDRKIGPIMFIWIVVSIALVVWLNKATKPDCTTHDYVFCGTELHDAHEAPAGGAHGAQGDDHGAAPGHAAPH